MKAHDRTWYGRVPSKHYNEATALRKGSERKEMWQQQRLRGSLGCSGRSPRMILMPIQEVCVLVCAAAQTHAKSPVLSSCFSSPPHLTCLQVSPLADDKATEPAWGKRARMWRGSA